MSNAIKIEIPEPTNNFVARNLGRDDGLEAVNETLAEQGREAVLVGLAEIDRGLNPWEEAAAQGSAHAFVPDMEWDDVTRRIYYRAYAESSEARAREIAAE